MTFTPLPSVETVGLFREERSALLALLAELSPVDWEAPTVCPGWSVKDIAAHLLGDDLGRLARGRDSFANPDFAAGLDISIFSGLVAAIDRQNAVWVAAMRRCSPALLIDLLRLSGEWTEAYFGGLDLTAIGPPVDWAGPEPAPVWFDVAREYTKRWVHQQHIRDAVARPGLKERRWLAPVLETFVQALPRALHDVAAAHGTMVRLTIRGEAGGEWVARRDDGQWVLGLAPDLPADATVELDQDDAWRLFTKGITPEQARMRARITGDATLARDALHTVAILA